MADLLIMDRKAKALVHRKASVIRKRVARQRKIAKRRFWFKFSELVIILFIFFSFMTLVLFQYRQKSPEVHNLTRSKILVSISLDTAIEDKLDASIREEIKDELNKGFGIVVPEYKFSGRPGEKISVGYGIANRMNQDAEFMAFVNGVSVRYSEANYGRIDTGVWTNPSQGPFSLNPDKAYVSTLDFKIPDAARPGEYNFHVYLCFQDKADASQDAGCSSKYNRKYSQTKTVVFNVID
jgi:hypothetical protein